MIQCDKRISGRRGSHHFTFPLILARQTLRAKLPEDQMIDGTKAYEAEVGRFQLK